MATSAGNLGRRLDIRGVGLLVVIILGFFTANVWLMARAEVDRGTLLVWLTAPACILVLVAALVVWIRSDYDRAEHVGRVLVWSILGVVTLGTGGALDGYVQVIEGNITVQVALQSAVGWASGGLLPGGLVGIYDAERRLERERTEEAREQAEQLAASLSVVNRVLRHDFRNHVTVLEGHFEFLADDNPERVAEMREHTTRIVELADRAREMERILTATDRVVVDAAATVEAVVDDLSERYGDATVTCTTPDRAMVRVVGPLEPAVENLVDNGVVHNDADTPTVDVAVTVGDSTVSIRVHDNGPGIPAHELAIHGRAEESPLEHSSGMGLWLVDWFADQSGGTIDIETGDAGTTVTLTVPRADRDA
ncbi:MAG: sensor histidine kinase [Halorientalis sp.]